jgi:hypothetical protein
VIGVGTAGKHQHGYREARDIGIDAAIARHEVGLGIVGYDRCHDIGPTRCMSERATAALGEADDGDLAGQRMGERCARAIAAASRSPPFWSSARMSLPSSKTTS